MARYVVTGGVGFIGFHTTRALLAQGHSVVVLDDLSDAPYPRAEKEQNLRDLRAEGGRFGFVEGCVTDRKAIAPVFAGADRVIHLAGLAGVRPSFKDPARYARVNVEGTATVLELALERGVRRVAFASSSSVYGNSTPLPASEDAPAVVPESPYAASKRGAELWPGPSVCGCRTSRAPRSGTSPSTGRARGPRWPSRSSRARRSLDTPSPSSATGACGGTSRT